MPEKQYRDWNPDQPFLLPPSLQEWLPEDHPVYLMLDVLEELDVSAIDRKYQEKDPRGTRPYAPKMMVGLLLYGYSVGVRSSRKLEKEAKQGRAEEVQAKADRARKRAETHESKKERSRSATLAEKWDEEAEQLRQEATGQAGEEAGDAEAPEGMPKHPSKDRDRRDAEAEHAAKLYRSGQPDHGEGGRIFAGLQLPASR